MSLLDVCSVYRKFEFVTARPLTHQSPCRAGGNTSGKKLAVKIERGLLALILDMEVWRFMIPEIHPDNDPKKG